MAQLRDPQSDVTSRGIRFAPSTIKEAQQSPFDYLNFISDVHSSVFRNKTEQKEGPIKKVGMKKNRPTGALPESEDGDTYLDDGLTLKERNSILKLGRDTNIAQLKKILPQERAAELYKAVSPPIMKKTIERLSPEQGEKAEAINKRAEQRLKGATVKDKPSLGLVPQAGPPDVDQLPDTFAPLVGPPEPRGGISQFAEKFQQNPLEVLDDATTEQAEKITQDSSIETSAKDKMDKNADPEDFSLMEKIALAGLVVLPSLVGYALEGTEGAYYGAAATGEGLKAAGKVELKNRDKIKKIEGDEYEDMALAEGLPQEDLSAEAKQFAEQTGSPHAAPLFAKLVKNMEMQPIYKGETPKQAIERGKAARNLAVSVMQLTQRANKADQDAILKTMDMTLDEQKAKDSNELKRVGLAIRKQAAEKTVSSKGLTESIKKAKVGAMTPGDPENEARINARLPEGVGLKPGKLPPADKEIGNVAAQLGQYEAALVGLDELQELIQEHGPQLAWSPTGAKMASLAQSITLSFKEFKNLGVLNGPDVRVLKNILGDPADWKSVALDTANRAFAGKKLGELTIAKIKEARKYLKLERFQDVDKANFYMYKKHPSSGDTYRSILQDGKLVWTKD